MQQFESGFDKFLFHPLRGDLVQLPSFQSKRSKRPETQVEIFETLPSNSIRESMILRKSGRFGRFVTSSSICPQVRKEADFFDS